MKFRRIILSTLILIGDCLGPEHSFQWSPGFENALQKIYKDANMMGGNLKQRIKAEWDQVFPMYSHLDSDYLWQHAQSLTRINEMKNKKRTLKRYKWTKEADENLVKIYFDTEKHSKKMYEKWVAENSEPTNITAKQLIRRAIYLTRQRNRTYTITVRKYFDWTDELNADLLHVYHQTNTGVRGHQTRLWKIWKEMHPDLTDMGLDGLRMHARDLMKRGYKPRVEDEKKAREHFDGLLMAHLYEYNSTEASPERSKRKGKHVLSPARYLPSTSQQDHDDHDQYDDIIMFSPLLHQHFYDDPHQYMDPMLLNDPPHDHNETDHHGHHSNSSGPSDGFR